MMPINQDSAKNLLLNLPSTLNSIKGLPSKVHTLTENTAEAIECIGKLSKIIVETIKWTTTILFNPVVLLTAVDKLAIVVILCLLVLKMIGFEKLEKWITLSIILKVIAMVFI